MLLNAKADMLSTSGVDHLRFRLRSIFEMAVSEGVVDRNPATTLYTPRHCKPNRERRVLTAEDFGKMLNVLEMREKVIVRLATIEGMRPGEIMALQVGDLALGEHRLRVKRRLYRGKMDMPKTERSTRDVALSAGTVLLLTLWEKTLLLSGSVNWVFPSENPQTPFWKDNIWWRHLLPRLKRIGLAWANFQVTRRTFATRSKEVGVDAHTRSAQMGNTVDVNENEYAVSDFKTRLAAVRKFETAFVQ